MPTLYLVDQCIGGCRCHRCGCCIISCCCVQASARNLDKEHLAAADLGDLGVVAIGDLDHVLDLGRDRIAVLDNAAVHAATKNLVGLAAHLTGLECFLDTGEVNCHSPLGEVNDTSCAFVDQRADLVDGDVAL